jgi:hypothetical protein
MTAVGNDGGDSDDPDTGRRDGARDARSHFALAQRP